MKEGPTTELGGYPEQVLQVLQQTGVCRVSEISNDFVLLKGSPSSVADFKKFYPKLSETQIAQNMKADKWETALALNK